MVRIKIESDGSATIRCLQCGDKLFKHNGKTTIYHEVKCPKCKKLTRYYPDMQMAELRDIPERTTSSGCRFY